MSLATRCNACGTVFRVVQDQLKVSEGWVRCGRCDEVFNAIDGLFDLERDAPPDWKPPPSEPVPPAAVVAAAFEPRAVPRDDEDVFALDEDDRIHSRFFQPEQADVGHSPAAGLPSRDRLDFADARFNTDLLGEVALSDPADSEAEDADGQDRSTPDFLRRAERQARQRTPLVRAMLGLVSLLLLGALAAQAALHFRDEVAARWPASRPWLAQACTRLQCRIELPRRIDDISVESSALTPAAGGTAYRLSLVLRNRGSLVVALPSIDLTLTDPNGQLVVRRALAPTDFRADTASIAAGAESPLQLLLATEGRRVSGYTVEVFYP